MNENEFGLPTEADIFEEIAKSEQHIKVTLVTRRYGKKITLVEGFDKHIDVKSIAKSLKATLACGGTTKYHIIELQGDHRKKVKPILVKMGFAEGSIND